eukprot:m.111860 g.111860  ORF g.111860 m.111860 type:complete len:71 (-) comp10766_c0_seq2:2904-3116(-)
MRGQYSTAVMHAPAWGGLANRVSSPLPHQVKETHPHSRRLLRLDNVKKRLPDIFTLQHIFRFKFLQRFTG